MRIAFLALVSLMLLGCEKSPERNNAGSASQPSASQSSLEQAADAAANAIDAARDDFPPLGADPTEYNVNVTKAYRAWQRAAEAAYGRDYRNAWRSKHIITGGCDLAVRTGMPPEACAQAEADAAEMPPLESYLMYCPSWDDPSGAIFNPHDKAACAAHAADLAAGRKPAVQHFVPDPDYQPDTGNGSPAAPADATSGVDQAATGTGESADGESQ
jgi:outer membrane murein-binding lipoprotein Lpp